MNSAVCTLFEGHYHYGLAGLVNSLIANGFSGEIMAGFRGPLPQWTTHLSRIEGESVFRVSGEVSLQFVPLETKAHLTNYKPDFLLSFVDRFEKLVYADPDLFLDTPFSFVADCLDVDILVCEDINSPLTSNDPRRRGWRKHLRGYVPHSSGTLYANGGFVGIDQSATDLLELWRDFGKQISEHLGGDDIVGISGGRRVDRYGHANCFDKTDQDALNAALDVIAPERTSFLSRRAMGFMAGENILPHALGGTKPWRKNYLRSLLHGFPPTSADKAFWRYVGLGPIQPFPAALVTRQRRLVSLCSLLGRFYCRR